MTLIMLFYGVMMWDYCKPEWQKLDADDSLANINSEVNK